MKILFLHIAWMKYYQGIWDGDQPAEGDVPECCNFQPMNVRFSKETGRKSGEYCLGYCETTATGSMEPQIHLERIPDCENHKIKDMADSVLVVWCAERQSGEAAVVGWYADASVSRYYRSLTLQDEKDPVDILFNVFARSRDCVLLPVKTRSAGPWRLPCPDQGGPDFRREPHWYAAAEAPDLAKRIVKAIQSYHGDNWTGIDPDTLA